jgi:hypothetical protein
MWPLWICLGGIALYMVGSVIEWLADQANGGRRRQGMGCLYLLAIPISIITLPIKLALDMMRSGRGRRKRR